MHTQLTPLSSEEYRARSLTLLDRFVQICTENGLQYYLAFGTALGAVRHQGFIPWDDDIDVCMPREDYEKLRVLLAEPAEDVSVLDAVNTPGYTSFFMKFNDNQTSLIFKYVKDCPALGIYIDVFPLDTICLNDEDLARYKKKLANCVRMVNLSSMKKFWPASNPIKSLVKFALYKYAKLRGNPHYLHQIQKIIAQASALQSGDQYQYICEATILPKDLFGVGTPKAYEGRQFLCPQDTDRYLRCLYNDYMQLPPPDQRVTPHDFQVFLRCKHNQ